MENLKRLFHQIRRGLAKIWLGFFSKLTIIGITGSYGKTNTTRAIATVLSEKFPTLQTDLNLDTVYNLPITLLKLRLKHRKLVLEYGVDHKGEMDFHLSLVKPSIAVVTGINPTHSDPELLGSIEGIIKEKSKLIISLSKTGRAILNWDDERVRSMAKATQGEVIRYGTTSGCDYWADQIKIDFNGTSFVLHTGKSKQKITTGLVGRHFVHACLTAAIVGRLQGLTWQEIKKGLTKLTPLPGRLSIEKGPRGSILLNDALRANPASTLTGLQTLVDLPLRQAQGKRIAVLGEMGELGCLAESEHERVGKELAKLKLNYVISIGPLQKLTAQSAIKAGMKKEEVFWVENVQEAANTLKTILKKGDLLYLKGSLLRHLERVILLLKAKKAGCRVVSCHFYHSCEICPNLQKIS